MPTTVNRYVILLRGVMPTDLIRVTDASLYTLYATKQSDSRFPNNFFESRLKVKATTRNLTP